MNSFIRSRAGTVAAMTIVAFWSLAVSACGGSPVPSEIGVPGGGSGGEVDAKTFSVLPQVFGEDGTGSTSAARVGRGISSTTRGLTELRDPPSSRAADMFGVSGDKTTKRVPKAGLGDRGSRAGSNGNDLVDLNGNNLFVSGLTDTSINASITFKTQGDNQTVGSITITAGQLNSTPLELSSTGLGSGQNLVVELDTGAGVSTAVLPSSFFSNGGNYGFNVIRRPDASLILEVFPDNGPPAGASDNGTRIVIDTAVDALKDNNLVTVARFETPDGLILFDSNLDGIFGGIEDGVRLFNTNNDFDENGNPIIDQKDDLVSFALDPNLDGSTGPNETRLLGNNIPEDFINSITLSANPTNPVGNGLSAITLRTLIEPAFDGNPIGATLSLSLDLEEGTLQEGVTAGANARFLASGSETLQRSIDPLNPSVRILAGGVIEITDAIRTPILTTDGKLKVTISYLTSTSQAPRSTNIVVDLTRNTAPTLGRVNFIGTLPINPALQGLEALSADARVVSGSTVQILGSNFATDITQVRVTFGGVNAPVLFVSNDGTEILCTVPDGAGSGPIAVIQGSVGANTSQNFVVAGPPIAIESVLPGDAATNVGLGNAISVRFNQAINANSLSNGFLIRAQGGAPVSGNSPTVSEDGRTVTFVPPTPLAPSQVYEIVLTGGLEAVNGVRFDADVANDVLPANEPELIFSSFTTGAAAGSDTIPPTVSSAALTPPNAPGARWEVRVEFSEGINPGSILVSGVPVETDTFVFWQGTGTGMASAAKVPLSLRFEGTEGQVVVATLLEAPLGRSDWSLTIGTAVTDTSSNALASVFSQSFSVPLRVDALSRISGPPGSEVVIEGSTFGTASEVTVTFAGENGRLPAQVVDSSLLDISVTVPAGAVDGVVEVSVGGQIAASSRQFAVTSAGFTPRVITTGSGAFGIAVNFDDQALVSFQGAGVLGLIDLSTETPIDINPATSAIDGITVGGVPTAARLDQTGTLGFTTNYGSREVAGSTVFAIEMATRSVRAAIPVGARPTRIAISPDNRLAYVTCFDDDIVSIIDIENLVVEATIDVGVGPNGIAISPDNQRGYVCNFLDSTVTVFSVASQQPLFDFPVGANPARVHLSNDSRTLFVSNFGDDTISVIDTETQAVLQVIQGFSGPSAMLFTTDEQRFFVTNRLQNTIQEVVKGSNNMWEQGEIRIATGETPSALSLSTDAALLVYTCEGSGEVGVVTIGDAQPVVSGFALNENGRPGRPVFNADRRQQIWVTGRGFGSTTSDGSLNIQVAGVQLPVVASPFATRRQVLVDIPDEARSGSLTVTRTLSAEDVRVSNSLPLLITRRSPTVVSVTPGDGSVSVASNARVVVDMSEPLNPATIFVSGNNGPVRTVGGAPVVRVARLSDVGGSPTNIPGSWRLISQGFRLEFTPAGEDPYLAPESNNLYEVVITPSVRDLYGNGVVGASTSFASAQNTNLGASTTTGAAAASLGFRSRFQTSDLLGPRIIAAVFRDLDNNGAGPGDQLELRFDEDLRLSLGSFDFAPAITLLGNPGDSLGTIVTASFGSTPRRLLLTLGVGARFAVTSTLPSVNISGTTVAGVTDYFNNAPAVGQNIPITLDPASDNQDNPNLLAAYVLDVNSSGTIDANDELRLVFNEPVFRGNAALSGVPSSFLTLTSGSLGSAVFVARASGEDFRVLRVQLAADSSLTGGITQLSLVNSGSPLPNGLTVMAADAFVDLIGNPAYAGAFSLRTVTLGLPAAATLLNDVGNRPSLYDLEGTLEGLSEGDAIVVPYTSVVLFEPLRGGQVLRPADVFALGVRGDSFGSGARLAQPAYITLRGGTRRPITPNEVVIFLGTEPVLTPVGDFGVDLFGGQLTPAQAGRLKN